MTFRLHWRTVIVIVGALAAALALTAISILPASGTTKHTAGAVDHTGFTTWEYLPGVEADLYLPERTRPHRVPLVVMIPGGGWQTADRSGLGQLAEALRDNGIAVTNATYRVGTEDSRFPVPVQDIRCAVDASVDKVRHAGFHPDPVVVLGHSAGAHLSSLATFGERSFRSPECHKLPARVNGWVGLSGVYDLRIVGEWSWTMMGGSAEELPELYEQAATETHLATRGRPHIDALVAQGDADEILTTTAIATGFADLLQEHRYRTRLEIIPGADHQATYQAPVIASTILDWLATVRP